MDTCAGAAKSLHTYIQDRDIDKVSHEMRLCVSYYRGVFTACVRTGAGRNLEQQHQHVLTVILRSEA